MAQLDKWSRNAPTLLTRTRSRAALEARQQALAMETFTSSRAATPKASHLTRRDGAGRERANGAASRRDASTKSSASLHSNLPPPPQLKLDTSRLHLIVVTRDGFGKNPAMANALSRCQQRRLCLVLRRRPTPGFTPKTAHVSASSSRCALRCSVLCGGHDAAYSSDDSELYKNRNSQNLIRYRVSGNGVI